MQCFNDLLHTQILPARVNSSDCGAHVAWNTHPVCQEVSDRRLLRAKCAHQPEVLSQNFPKGLIPLQLLLADSVCHQCGCECLGQRGDPDPRGFLHGQALVVVANSKAFGENRLSVLRAKHIRYFIY